MHVIRFINIQYLTWFTKEECSSLKYLSPTRPALTLQIDPNVPVTLSYPCFSAAAILKFGPCFCVARNLIFVSSRSQWVEVLVMPGIVNDGSQAADSDSSVEEWNGSISRNMKSCSRREESENCNFSDSDRESDSMDEAPWRMKRKKSVSLSTKTEEDERRRQDTHKEGNAIVDGLLRKYTTLFD